jgi:RNA polymerase sigma-70 factor, ECF subfamily
MSTLKHLVDRVARELLDETTRKLQEYLLGGLSARQRTAIGRRIIVDEAFYQDLIAAEDALVQDYVRGFLPPETAERVARLRDSSPQWAEKIVFAKATRVVLERQARQGAAYRGAELFEATYAELYTLAQKALRRANQQETTEITEPDALVNEVYLRMHGRQFFPKEERVQFLAAVAMRRVLVDIARARGAVRRDAGPKRVTEVPVASVEERVLDLEFALLALAEANGRASRIIELKVFGGLTNEEVANVLGITSRTIRRDWHFALAWLKNYFNVTKAPQSLHRIQ